MITSFEISKTELHKSVNYIIEAIMKCKELQITFPTNHDDQRKIAEGFKKISSWIWLSGKQRTCENAFIRLEESMNKLQKLETQKLIHDKQEIWFTHTSNLHHEVEGTPAYNNKTKYIKILEKQIADLQAQLDCNDIDDIAI